MKPQVIKRRVLISETDLKKLKKQALVKSDYGHKNLYDTCEWRPVTTKDMLLDMLRYNRNFRFASQWMQTVGSSSLYSRKYDDPFKIEIIDDTLHVRIGREWRPLGWAILTKTIN
jgi:hypothetical protein